MGTCWRKIGSGFWAAFALARLSGDIFLSLCSVLVFKLWGGLGHWYRLFAVYHVRVIDHKLPFILPD
jgi:hypothetical protein